MNLLAIYVTEKQHHGGMPVYEWLLKEARGMGVHGGSAFRSIASFGRHGHMHEQTFFELAGELAVKVEFVIDDALVDKLLDVVKKNNLNLFYTRQPVQASA